MSDGRADEYYELNEKLLAENNRLQATIEELERTVEAKRQTIEYALMIDEKQQNKIAEQKATIKDLQAENRELRADLNAEIQFGGAS